MVFESFARREKIKIINVLMRQKNREMKWGKSCTAFKLAGGTCYLVTSIKTELLASFCQNHSWVSSIYVLPYLD